MDQFLIPVCAVLVALAAFQIWRKRASFWWPPVVILLLAMALFLAYLFSGFVVTYFFEDLVGRILAFLFVAFLNWIFLRAILPRAETQQSAKGILLLTIGFPLALLITAAAWWIAAVEINAYPANPMVRNGAEFEQDYNEHATLLNYRGMYLVGRIGDVTAIEKEPETIPGFVAYYKASGSTGGDPARFPLEYIVTLGDDTEVAVSGIESVEQTFAWPEIPLRNFYHGLKHGDPVVVWGNPGSRTQLGGGEQSWAIVNTRVIAHGMPEDFIRNFVMPGVRTARVFGWVGFGCLFLAPIPFALGLRKYFRLRRLSVGGKADA